MEDPPTAWEFYIMRQAKRRLGVSRAAESIINVYEMHLYSDECYLIEEFRDQGTLLDVINIARAESTTPLGQASWTKASSCSSPSNSSAPSKHCTRKVSSTAISKRIIVSTSGSRPRLVTSGRLNIVKMEPVGWNKKGVALIDFGRGIDMKVFRSRCAVHRGLENRTTRLC